MPDIEPVDIPDDFERYLIVHATADAAWVFSDLDPDNKLQVVVLGVWALPEGTVDANEAKKFVFISDSELAASFADSVLVSAARIPSIVEQKEEDVA